MLTGEYIQGRCIICNKLVRNVEARKMISFIHQDRYDKYVNMFINRCTTSLCVLILWKIGREKQATTGHQHSAVPPVRSGVVLLESDVTRLFVKMFLRVRSLCFTSLSSLLVERYGTDVQMVMFFSMLLTGFTYSMQVSCLSHKYRYFESPR